MGRPRPGYFQAPPGLASGAAQPLASGGLLAEAATTNNVWQVVVGAYVPQGKIESPHLATSTTGHTRAASFRQLEIAARRFVGLSGVAGQAGLEGEGSRPPLVSGMAHSVLDACPTVCAVIDGDDKTRVNAEQLCRKACSDPSLREAMVAAYTASLRVAASKGFTHVEVFFFSKPSLEVLPLRGAAAPSRGLRGGWPRAHRHHAL